METLNHYVDMKLHDGCRYKPVTLQSYRYVYNQYIAQGIGKLSIGAITTAVIYDHLKSTVVDKGLALSNANMVLSIISQVYEDLIFRGVVKSNPCNGVRRKLASESRYKRKEPVALTDKQILDFLDSAKDSITGRNHYNIFVFLIGTGCRISEALAMTWDSIDFDKGFIRVEGGLHQVSGGVDRRDVVVTEPKSLSGYRDIPMLGKVREALLDEREKYEMLGGCVTTIDGISNFVFLNSRRNVVRAGAVRDAIDAVVKKHNKDKKEGEGLPHITLHNFRHTFCTKLIREGVNLKAVQTVMGHSKISMTMDVYTHISKQDVKNEFSSISF